MGSKTQNVEVETTQQPAVGFDATRASTSDAARVVLRAQNRGHSVIVGHGGAASEAVRLARYAGAITLDVSDATGESIRSALTRAAKTYGFEGLLWHERPSEHIDYRRSVLKSESADDFVVVADTDSDRSVGQNTVLVAIPAYNESGTIADVVGEARGVADRVVVVDDGSDDGTAKTAEEAGATVVRHDRNRGYGAAIKTAFQTAVEYDAEHLVIIDGDGQHDPEDVPKLIKAQHENDAEIAIGSRFRGESDVPFYRRIGLVVINVMTNVGLGNIRPRSWIRDTQSGLRAYDSTAIRSIAEDDSIADHMDASTDIIYHARNRDYTVTEVGTEIDYDVENGNSQNPISHGLVLVTNLLHLIERERPITLIGVPGFAVTFLGFGFGYWTILNSLNTDTFPVGLALVSAFFTLTGVLACFSALILHSIEVHLDSS